jgi:transposase
MPRGHNPKPPYPAQFRQQMIELVAAGRKPNELAREFGCHETSITNWVRTANASQASVSSPATAGALNATERQELQELRRKLRQVQQERDILAKATAWFANKGEQTFTPSTR